MRVKGKVETCGVVILIDTGNTHNFVNHTIGLGWESMEGTKWLWGLQIAKKCLVNGLIENMALFIQHNEFTIEAYILLLAEYDLVLGVS